MIAKHGVDKPSELGRREVIAISYFYDKAKEGKLVDGGAMIGKLNINDVSSNCFCIL